jgi:hypothetical protein
MPEITGVITQAAPRVVERRDGSGSFTLYDVFIDGQGPFVARRDVFNQAKSLEGFRVNAVTRSEQKGNFLNHYLDFVGPADGSHMPQQPAPQQQPAQPHQPTQPGPQQTAAQIMREGETAQEEAERRKTLSIHRQTATKVAAVISAGSPIDFWANVEAIVHYYATGQTPVGVTPQQQPQQPRQNADAYRQFQEQNQFVPAGAYQQDPGPQEGQYASTADDESLPF